VGAQPPLDGGALHAFASSVNQADEREPRRLRLEQVLIDDIRYVARVKRVQVDPVLDRDADRPGALVLSVAHIRL
jgi:hypothetical protein